MAELQGRERMDKFQTNLDQCTPLAQQEASGSASSGHPSSQPQSGTPATPLRSLPTAMSGTTLFRKEYATQPGLAIREGLRNDASLSSIFTLWRCFGTPLSLYSAKGEISKSMRQGKATPSGRSWNKVMHDTVVAGA